MSEIFADIRLRREFTIACSLSPAPEVGEQIQLTWRFDEGLTFNPDRFLISDAGDWRVHDLRIQYMTQLTRPDVSGEQLHEGLKASGVDRMRHGHEILLIVSRQKPGDQPFSCKVQGWFVP